MSAARHVCWRTLGLVVALAGLCLGPSLRPARGQATDAIEEIPRLFEAARPVAPAGLGQEAGEPGGTRFVRLNGAAVDAAGVLAMRSGSRLRVNWFGDLEQTVVVRTREFPGENRCVWVGEVEGAPGSLAVFALADGALVGTTTVPGGATHRVAPVGDGLHAVETVALSGARRCGLELLRGIGVEAAPPRAEVGPDAADGSGEGGGGGSRAGLMTPLGAGVPVIDFLVVYSQRALAGAGGAAGLQALVDFFIAEARAVYANSRVQADWQVVHLEQVDYTESGNLATDWSRLANPSDGKLDQVHALRDLYAADLVMLIVEVDEQGYAGVAANNFTVFRRPYIAAGHYTVTHEVGHLFGAGHDHLTCTEYAPGNCGAATSYAYGHRFVAQGTTYTTVMGYEPGSSLPYLSNPDVLFLGVPTGRPQGALDAADNARAVREMAPSISQQRLAESRYDLSLARESVSESETVFSVDIRRTGSTVAAGGVTLRTSDLTARSGRDYAAYSKQVDFAAGETVKTVPLTLLPDDAAEGFEQFQLALSSPKRGALGLRTTAIIGIEDDEPVVRMAAATETVSDAEGTVRVRLVRTGRSDQEASVAYRTADGTATRGVDYDTASGRVTFAAGQTDQEIAVNVRVDAEAEPDETFQIILESPLGAGLVAPVQTTVRIVDGQRRGSLDRAFAAVSRVNDMVQAIAVRPDGRILCGGYFTEAGGAPCTELVQLLPDGRIDPAFLPVRLEQSGTQGQRLLPTTVARIVLAGDGSAYLAGAFTSVNGVARNGLARVRPDGSLDPAFVPLSGPDGSVAVIQPLAAGQVLIAGAFRSVSGWPSGLVARLNADGSPDRTFLASPRPQGYMVRAVAMQPDGKLVVGGMFTGFDSVARSHLARLDARGQADAAFSPPTFNGPISGLAPTPDGSLLVAGYFSSPSPGKLVRLRPDLRLDSGFSASPAFDAPIGTLVRGPDGALYVGGGFNGATGRAGSFLARLLPNGSPDPGFDTGTGPDDMVLGIALEPDGDVLAGGMFKRVNGVASPFLARFRGEDLRPVLGRTGALADGRIAFRITGKAGERYVIQRSTDLVAWVNLETVTLATSAADWTEPQPNVSRVRFYRARLEPR